METYCGQIDVASKLMKWNTTHYLLKYLLDFCQEGLWRAHSRFKFSHKLTGRVSMPSEVKLVQATRLFSELRKKNTTNGILVLINFIQFKTVCYKKYFKISLMFKTFTAYSMLFLLNPICIYFLKLQIRICISMLLCPWKC